MKIVLEKIELNKINEWDRSGYCVRLHIYTETSLSKLFLAWSFENVEYLYFNVFSEEKVGGVHSFIRSILFFSDLVTFEDLVTIDLLICLDFISTHWQKNERNTVFSETAANYDSQSIWIIAGTFLHPNPFVSFVQLLLKCRKFSHRKTPSVNARHNRTS